MGLLRSSFRRALPVSRVGAALWAWQHRKEIAGWAGWAARAAPRVVAGNQRDVVAEGRLRARLSSDPRTRSASNLDVEVVEGVAILAGEVDPEVHDAVVELATGASGVMRVRDEIRERTPRRS
ncbi:MAG: BON domain-containing protein [Actinobacteria bacterium]|nr:BON domain-containing protein [Actinomycetota bacterium]